MKRVFTAILAVVAFAQAANAQSEIKNERLAREKSTISISFDIDSQQSSVPNMLKEVITPYLSNNVDTLWLSPVEIFGKGRFKRERQERHIAGDKRWALGEGQVMRGTTYNYIYKGSVEPWMAKATLGINRSIVGCSKCDVISRNETLAEASLFVIPPFVLDDVARRWSAAQDESTVKFKVSKVDIDNALFDNEAAFSKILAVVDKIYSHPHYKADKIQVVGFASPEGTTEFNAWLGENRAKALVDYIIAQRPNYSLTYENFEVVNGKENWSGLREALCDSNVAKRDAVLAIIDNAELSRETKKQHIKAIDGGRTWSKILTDIYPHLRSARYLALYYDSTKDSAIDTINKANAMIRDGKPAEAYELAMTVASDDRAYNTIGVALMAQGKFKTAISWFEKAVKSGDKSAQKNIDAIEAEYGTLTK